jgi:hypothetical protein
LWAEEYLHEEAESRDQSQEYKRELATLWFEEELRNNLVLGARTGWKGFRFKPINGDDK